MTLTAYERAQRAGQSAVRTTILDAATHLLVAEGVGALTMRRIAAEVGCSTKVIYTMFGGKDGLAEALWLEGFMRFGRALRAVPADADPVAYLAALGWAYRDYALAEPDYYRVMFQGVIPGFTPGVQARQTARGTFEIAVAAVAACMAAGRMVQGDPVEVADVIWMAVHGAVGLELAGFMRPEEAVQRFRALTTWLVGALLIPPDEISR
jgi:AcrR family transcriptional regulator